MRDFSSYGPPFFLAWYGGKVETIKTMLMPLDIDLGLPECIFWQSSAAVGGDAARVCVCETSEKM